MLIEHEALRFNRTNCIFERIKSLTVTEEIIDVYVNGDLYATFHCLPSQIKELVVGHLLTEGIIGDLKDLIELKVTGKSVYVELPEKAFLDSIRRRRLITTFFGNSVIKPDLLEKASKLGFNKVRFSAETVFKAVEALNSISPIYKASKGSHGALLIDEYCNIMSFAEDVSRHNAIDKVIGDAALRDIDLTKLLLASTGRLTSEIVVKASRVGIQVLVSLAAPTSLGIKIAGNLGLTIIGFAGERYFHIYTFPERIRETEKGK
ncbi:MAG: formate dehydrogenase accessory sulfurtransferase FdhD [Candidatus Bathyarchaeia archaeon]